MPYTKSPNQIAQNKFKKGEKMNGFVPHIQTLKCPKCGKKKVITAGCVMNFYSCPKCNTMMIPSSGNFIDKLIGKLKGGR